MNGEKLDRKILDRKILDRKMKEKKIHCLVAPN